jgi:hypothetical protein
MSLEMTRQLKWELAHLYYREACDQKGWAYANLKGIEVRDGAVVFAKGVHNINIRLPDQIVAEIRPVSKLESGGRPLFDYLACKVSQREKYEGVMVANPTALTWVQVKTTKGEFSEKELDALENIRIPLALFYIRDVLTQPQKIEAKWIIKTGEEWLNELDDKRDQAESDDDFL